MHRDRPLWCEAHASYGPGYSSRSTKLVNGLGGTARPRRPPRRGAPINGDGPSGPACRRPPPAAPAPQGSGSWSDPPTSANPRGHRPRAAQRLGRTGDEGLDGVIYEDRLGLDMIYVRAKRWSDRVVRRPDVQAFVGALQGARAQGLRTEAGRWGLLRRRRTAQQLLRSAAHSSQRVAQTL